MIDPGWKLFLEWIGWYVMIPLVGLAIAFGILGLIGVVIYDVTTAWKGRKK